MDDYKMIAEMPASEMIGFVDDETNGAITDLSQSMGKVLGMLEAGILPSEDEFQTTVGIMQEITDMTQMQINDMKRKYFELRFKANEEA